MAQNMYRVGDYVYFEALPSAPFHIRRIEELNKTASGAVEAKVTCFFRRRDLPDSLLKIADQAGRQNKILYKPRKTLLVGKQSSDVPVMAVSANGREPKENGMLEASSSAEDRKSSSVEPVETKKENDDNLHENNNNNNKTEQDVANSNSSQQQQQQPPKCYGFAGLPQGATQLNTEQLHELRQRELFLSRVIETLPATQIRGKCTVVILNEVETCEMYIGREDAFFYSLVFDPSNQTLLADKGRVELGERHQATIPKLNAEEEEEPTPSTAASTSCDGDKIETRQKDVQKMECDESVEGVLEQEKNNQQDDDKQQNDVETSANVNDTAEPTTSSNSDKVTKSDETPPPHPTFSGESERERCVYHPYHSLNDLEIDQFLLVARAVGTFSRALDSSSSTKLPTLHQTASAASRDITLLHAMALLHQANYDLGKATKYLVPPADTNHYPLEADKLTAHNTANLGGPILCRDQLEEWSASESTLFEDAIEKYGKDFHDIRLDCLPWKAIRDIVEYYYMWKTTSRYAELQKAKHAERENKLKQVYIPNYNKSSANLIGGGAAQDSKQQIQERVKSSVPCESCNVFEAPFWYFWGPAHQLRLCGDCWNIWKKRGGLRRSHEFDTYDLDGAGNGREVGGGAQAGTNRPNATSGSRASSQAANPKAAIIPPGGQLFVSQKGRVAFYLNSPLETRIARRISPKQVFNVRKAARAPFFEFDLKAIQDFYFGRSLVDVLHAARQLKRGTISRAAIEHLSKLHKRGTTQAAAANGNK